jgi:hypothetical protein
MATEAKLLDATELAEVSIWLAERVLLTENTAGKFARLLEHVRALQAHIDAQAARIGELEAALRGLAEQILTAVPAGCVAVEAELLKQLEGGCDWPFSNIHDPMCRYCQHEEPCDQAVQQAEAILEAKEEGSEANG